MLLLLSCAQAVQRLHAAFTELAGKYHVIRQALAACKEQYITMHRWVVLVALNHSWFVIFVIVRTGVRNHSEAFLNVVRI